MNKSELFEHDRYGNPVPEDKRTIQTTAGELIILLKELQTYRNSDS